LELVRYIKENNTTKKNDQQSTNLLDGMKSLMYFALEHTIKLIQKPVASTFVCLFVL